METINTYYEDFTSLSKFVESNHHVLFDLEVSDILVQVFSGQNKPDVLLRLSSEILELIPNAKIIGTTTSGEIMNGQVTGLNIAISFTVFHNTMVKTAIFPKQEQHEFDLGKYIASELVSDMAKVLILFATGLDSDQVLKGIQLVCPTLPVAGGIASDNSHLRPSSVFCGDQTTCCGIVGAILESEDLKVNQFCHLGWQPIGKEMTITKVEGLRVYTIDNIPAYQVYQHYLGLDQIGNFSNVIEYPLVAKRSGVLTARTPHVLYEDDSIGFAGELLEGEKVRLSYGNVGIISEAVSNLCNEIRKQPVESIFIYSCESRRGYLQDLSKIETEPFQEIAPTVGFYTFGEFFHKNAINQLLNATMTILILAEPGCMLKKKPMARIGLNNMGKTGSSTEDYIVARNTGVLKALTHLINKVTEELMTTNEKLKYVSQHDSLSGIYNRTFFEEAMMRLETTDNQVGIIVCDLDFLKLLNDYLGHDYGDKVIRMAANIITNCCHEDDIVARIGGDEFAILIPNGESSILNKISNRIITEAANLRNLDNDNILYLSVGYAFKGQGGSNNMRDAFKKADANMYRYKLTNKSYTERDIKQRLQNITNKGKLKKF